jgi:hypothetical protein
MNYNYETNTDARQSDRQTDRQTSGMSKTLSFLSQALPFTDRPLN